MTIDQRARLRSEVLERGEGSWVFTVDGEKYLDFSTGTGHWIFESLLFTSHQKMEWKIAEELFVKIQVMDLKS